MKSTKSSTGISIRFAKILSSRLELIVDHLSKTLARERVCQLLHVDGGAIIIAPPVWRGGSTEQLRGGDNLDVSGQTRKRADRSAKARGGRFNRITYL